MVNTFINGLRNHTYKWHNFYDIVDPAIGAMYNIENKFKFSTKSKILPLLFFDIEVDAVESEFPDPQKAKYPINSISIFNNTTNVLDLLIIPPKGVNKTQTEWIADIRHKYTNTVKDFPKYDIENIHIDVQVFKNDNALLKQFFNIIHTSGSIALLGYNSDLFDIPYIFNRLKNLNSNWRNIASKYGQVDVFKDTKYEIPDIIFIDMLYLYKPQSAGGAAMGKARLSYGLDYIANVEIGIGKLEYEGNLISLYTDDPVTFFAYNIFDSTLLHLLNKKLNHVDTLYGLTQFAGAPMSKALVGRSLLYQFNKTIDYWDNGMSIRSKIYNEEFIRAV
jgi:hypothetical protein